MRVQIIFSPRFLAMILFTATQIACTSTPDIQPDYTGIDHLSTALAVEARYPSASTLPQLMPGEVLSPYKIGVGDEIIISVWGRDDLGSQIPTDETGRVRTTRVLENGEINLPLIGSIPVAGKTIEEVRKAITSRHTSRLDISYVDVQLHSCHSQAVHITGAVNNPGLYYLCDRVSTFDDMLSTAKGLSEDAYAAGGVLKRDGQTFSLDYPLNEGAGSYLDILLQAGDSIYFPRTTERTEPVVYVFGEVGAQGVYIIPPQGMTLLDALGLASGPDNITAQVEAIYIMRQAPGTTEPATYQITLVELFENPDIELSNGDRIFVAPSDLSRWDRWWRQAIPIIRVP
jgi:polysaccharide export outer membrane protein